MAALMPARGFTLIELLIAVAVIGIAAGVLSLTLRGSETRALREEGDRLAALFRMAASEARVGGRTLVWEADLSGYRFRAAITGELPEELTRERRWAVAVNRLETPRVLFTREPLREPATLEIATAGHRLRLALDEFSNLRPAACDESGTEIRRCVASR